jgi:hypothetical protein
MTEDDGTWRRWHAMRQARAEIDAIEIAPKHEFVLQFRSKDLRGKLVPFDSVEDRLKDWELDQDHPLIGGVWDEETPVSSLHQFTVEFRPTGCPTSDPANRIELRVDIQKDSRLTRLRSISSWTAEMFGWTEESTAGWVLTGSLPTVPEMRMDRVPVDHEARQRWQAIEMWVPIEVPPSVLAQRYAVERAKALEDLPMMAGNPVGEKALNACTFALARNDGQSWEQVFKDWNQKPLPDGDRTGSAFRSARNFAHTARETYFRLTGNKLKWNRSRGQKES